MSSRIGATQTRSPQPRRPDPSSMAAASKLIGFCEAFRTFDRSSEQPLFRPSPPPGSPLGSHCRVGSGSMHIGFSAESIFRKGHGCTSTEVTVFNRLGYAGWLQPSGDTGDSRRRPHGIAATPSGLLLSSLGATASSANLCEGRPNHETRRTCHQARLRVARLGRN